MLQEHGKYLVEANALTQSIFHITVEERGVMKARNCGTKNFSGFTYDCTEEITI